MENIKVAFWNLQNLFDITASPIAADLEYTPDHGWDGEALEKKIENLSDVINGLHKGNGPDLLGICEIENKNVGEMLLGKLQRNDYKIAHVDTQDIRGIDVSLIYSGEIFELKDSVGHLVHLRYPTRDIFQVTLKVLRNGAELTVIVNHWPSRWRGLYETEPYRITVANFCGQIVDSILKYSRDKYLKMEDTPDTLDRLNTRWNRNILIMGDFNDEPFNRSIMDELKASSGTDKLEEPIKKSNGRNTPTPEKYIKNQAYLFNCMWPLLGQSDTGTHYYNKSTNTMPLLDQFIVSRGLYYGEQKLLFDQETMSIFTRIMSSGKKKRPKPFDKKSKTGYSDHFPIQAEIQLL